MVGELSITVSRPGTPKIILVTVASGAVTGSALHEMGGTPLCGKPNPNVADGASSTAYATANSTQVTVTCEIPTSQQIIFSVPVVI